MISPNPVGLAAGLDKDGRYIDGLASLGFGFIEIGTVTPRAQPGNPKPRMFRLPQTERHHQSHGALTMAASMPSSPMSKLRSFIQDKQGVLGLNIGKNADTPIEKAADDYLHCLEKVYPYASYNHRQHLFAQHQNLRQLQGASELDDLLSQLKRRATTTADQHKRYVPLTLKIAPDIDSEQIKTIAESPDAPTVDGVICDQYNHHTRRRQGLQHGERSWWFIG